MPLCDISKVDGVTIFTLDVCSKAGATISGKENLSVVEYIFAPVLFILIYIFAETTLLFNPLKLAFQDERPPKAHLYS
jgi:hypothetical protein